MNLNQDASGNLDADAKIVELAELRATRLGFPFVDVRKVQPSQEALEAVPAHVAQEYELLPRARAGSPRCGRQ